MKKNSKQLRLTDLLQCKTTNKVNNNDNCQDKNENSDNRIVSTDDVISPNKNVQSPSITTTDDFGHGLPYVQGPALNTVPIDLTPISSTERIMTPKSLRSIKFPISQFGKNKRCFKADWLDSFIWLEYSVSRDAAFCFPCRAFDVSGSKEYKFTVTGFTNWKKALEKKQGFYQHEASFHHICAMTSWAEKRERIRGETTVTELLSSVILRKRRFYMKSIVDVIFFLIENELAFRGDWDTEEHREIGVFRNLFEFKLKDSEELRDGQKIMPKNATYLSPEIQNELISIITKLVQEQITNDINFADVPFFTILVDGTKDRKNKECVSLAARYVLNGKPTVMSGDKGGIQRIIQDTLKRLIPYVHCVNHRLHLVVISAVDGVYLVTSFFESIKLIYAFFHRTKIQAVYTGKSILKLIDTRWAGHVRATNVIHNNLHEIIETLTGVADKKMSQFDAEDVAMANGIKQTILKKEFLFVLAFMQEFLNLVAPADKMLQSRDVGLREAMPIIKDVSSKILNLRSSCNFERILKSSEEMLPGYSVESESRPRSTRKKTRPTKLASSIITEKFGERNENFEVELKSTFNEVIDIFTSEMKRRFDDNEDILIAISEAQELCYEKLLPLTQLGVTLPTKEEMSVAKVYIERQKKMYDETQKNLKKAGEKATFKERFNVLAELFKMKEAFPEVYALIAAVDTFGSSTAVCECSFSALDRIGTAKRISMNNDRLRNLTFLAFEKKRLKNVSIDEVLKCFDKNPARKLQLY